jgi:hypothetical protein
VDFVISLTTEQKAAAPQSPYAKPERAVARGLTGMWPYEEHTLLENLAILIMPFIVLLILSLLMSLLEKRMEQKYSE